MAGRKLGKVTETHKGPKEKKYREARITEEVKA
jgi:hypothetical protein